MPSFVDYISVYAVGKKDYNQDIGVPSRFYIADRLLDV